MKLLCITGVNAFDMEDFFLFKEGAYNSVQAYKNSKAVNLMVSYELSRKLAEDEIVVNNVNPGLIYSLEIIVFYLIITK